MKETRISLFNLEALQPADYGTGKPVKVINYGLEVVFDVPRLERLKPLRTSNYTIEILQAYIDLSVDTPTYYFTGQVLDQVGPVSRELISYDRETFKPMDTSFSDSNGSFFLDSTTSGTCFLVALDDAGGTDYNHLIAAIVTPAVFDDYGFSQLNPGKSALDIQRYNPAATFDGLYWIQPTGYTSPIQVYCDMTTQGGGWTMCARWDRDFPGDWEVCLPVNAMRDNINIEDLKITNIEGIAQSATLDARALVQDGADKFMHTSQGIDDRTWTYYYFSDVYEEVKNFPDNLFNPALDTNVGEGVTGSLQSKSAEAGTRWYNYDFSTLTSYTLNNTSYNYCLVGGEGSGHWSIGSRSGASYASHPSSADVTSDDYVTWGFYGKDGSVPSDFSYTRPHRVGTHKSPGYPPSCRFNFMFMR